MTSEDLNLPASLERLEINSESRVENSKIDENPFSFRVSSPLGDAPECSLETLSLNAVCPKGSCLCNKKKDGSGRIINNNNNGTSSSLKSIVHHRRPILRRSKLNREVLRAPILRLGGSESNSEGSSIVKTSSSFKPKQDGSTKVIVTRTNSEPIPLCCTPVATCSVISTSLLQRPIITPSVNYITSAASSSHCCALQARSINNNSNNTALISTNTNLSPSTTSTDDTNIDELASYFDLLVHIPKKMSVMAEMMYI